MSTLKYVTLGLLLVIMFRGHSQETWTLERCFQYALDNNLDIFNARLDKESATLDLRSSNYQRLPSISGSTAFRWNFGRTIDPVTNAFDNQTIRSQGFGIDASAPIWNAGAISKGIKQSQYNLSSAENNYEFTQLNVLNIVAQGFLGVIVAEDQLLNAKATLDLSEEQLVQTDKLIKAGSVPVNDRLNILSQIALDRQNVIIAQNNVDRAYLDLQNLLNLTPDTDFVIERPVVEIPAGFDPASYTFIDLYRNAEKNSPAFKALEANTKSAELGVEIARTQYLPTLGAWANLNTNYSDVAKRASGEVETIFVEDDVTVNGTAVTIGQFVDRPIIEDYPYGDQLSDNFGQSVGLSLSIPIFDRFRARMGVQRAKLAMIQNKATNDRVIQDTKTSIQTSLNNARSAKQEFEAARAALDASEAAYENTEKQYELGAANTFDYSQARINFEVAKAGMIRAKYNYFLQLKILEWLSSDYSEPIDLFGE